MTFGEKFKAEREKRKLTQQEVAAALGINRRMITRYENGISFPRTKDAYRKIAEYFKVDVNYLLTAVSYTHLDVYKRQIQFIGIAENVFKRLLVFVPIFEDDFDCMVFVNQNAVNKGDVYKRQVCGLCSDTAADTAHGRSRRRTKSRRTAPLHRSGSGVCAVCVTPAPVSYTHLDVYKRQISSCA